MIRIVVDEEWDEDDCVYEFDSLKEVYDGIVNKTLICKNYDDKDDCVVTFNNFISLGDSKFIITNKHGYIGIDDFGKFDGSFESFEYFMNVWMKGD